jgi:hypothetical protein
MPPTTLPSLGVAASPEVGIVGVLLVLAPRGRALAAVVIGVLLTVLAWLIFILPAYFD